MLAAFHFPDPTGPIEFLVKILMGLINIASFFFRTPLLGMVTLGIIGGLYLFFRYASSKKE